MKSTVNLNPYIAGALVGVLATLFVVVSTQVLGKTQYLGASTTFVRAAGFVEQAMDPEHVQKNPYLLKEKVKIDWQFMLIVVIFVGALAASIIAGSFKLEAVPLLWRERFGGSMAMFGAWLADGCPSGHSGSGAYLHPVLRILRKKRAVTDA